MVEQLVALWMAVGVIVVLGLQWRKARLAARPELRDTNLPKARVRRRED